MKRLLPLLLLLALPACETVVNDAPWPEHTPRLAVKSSIAFVAADTVELRCLVRTTVPLGTPFRVEDTYITDAGVWMISEGDSLQLRHDREGLYTARALAARDGRVTLLVRHAGRTVTSTISVSRADFDFDTVFVRPEPGIPIFKQLVVRFRPEHAPGTTYGIDFEVYSPAPRQWLHAWRSTWRDGKVNYSTTVRLPDGRVEMVYSPYSMQLRVRTRPVLLSPEYGPWDDSRYNEYGGDISAGEPANPDFNAHGDGFGFFWWESRGGWREFQL